jgi:hypothetical protein
MMQYLKAMCGRIIHASGTLRHPSWSKDPKDWRKPIKCHGRGLLVTIDLAVAW